MITAIAIDDEPLALNVIKSLCDRNPDIKLKATFTKPGEAIHYLESTSIDLIFCDIQMPSMTGIHLVKALAQNPMVIFTTAFSEYAAASYELNAIDYLLKPVNQTRFDKAIEKASEYAEYRRLKESVHQNDIYIRADFSLVKIPLNDILYIEGLADYVKFYIHGRKTVISRITMKEVMDKMPQDRFIRVHRSYILPFSRIESVRGKVIYIGDQTFPIGKTYINSFFDRFEGN